MVMQARLPRSICELSEMKTLNLLTEVVAIQVYVFVQTHQIVYIKYVYFILHKVHFSDTDINRQDSD